MLFEACQGVGQYCWKRFVSRKVAARARETVVGVLQVVASLCSGIECPGGSHRLLVLFLPLLC